MSVLSSFIQSFSNRTSIGNELLVCYQLPFYKFYFPLSDEKLIDFGYNCGIIAAIENNDKCYEKERVLLLLNHNLEVNNKICLPFIDKVFRIKVLQNSDVIILTETKHVYLYNGNEVIKKFCFPNNHIILSAVFWETGVAIISHDGFVHVLDRFEKYNAYGQMKECFGADKLFVVPHHYTNGRGNIIGAINDNGDISIINSVSTLSFKQENPIISIEVSQNYKFIALIQTSKVCIITDASFAFEYTRIDLSDINGKMDIKWMNDNVFVIFHDDGLIVGTINGDKSPIQIRNIAFAIPENNSLLLGLSNILVRILIVPETLKGILTENMESHGYKVCQAYENRYNEPFFDSIVNIDLERALLECSDAILFSFNMSHQKLFFESICSFLRGKTRVLERFIEIVKFINELRNEAKIPVTSYQILPNFPNHISEILIKSSRYSYAFKYMKLFNFPLTPFIDKYAMSIIDTHKNDKDCLEELLSICEMNYYFCASYSFSVGRAFLANSLIYKEIDIDKRAKYYAGIRKWDLAYDIACESCSVSTQIEVLLHSLSCFDEIQGILINNSTLRNMLQHFPSLIEKKFNDKMTDPTSIFQEHRDAIFLLKSIQEEISNQIGDDAIVDMSFNDTIKFLFKRGLYKTAKHVANKVRISKKVYYRTAIKILFKEKEFDSLKTLLFKEKHSDMWEFAIGYFLLDQAECSKALLYSLQSKNRKYFNEILEKISNYEFFVGNLPDCDKNNKFY